MIPVKEACEPVCPGMHRPIFRKTEFDRAEKILSALDGLDIYSAQQLLEKVNVYLSLTTFKAPNP